MCRCGIRIRDEASVGVCHLVCCFLVLGGFRNDIVDVIVVVGLLSFLPLLFHLAELVDHLVVHWSSFIFSHIVESLPVLWLLRLFLAIMDDLAFSVRLMLLLKASDVVRRDCLMGVLCVLGRIAVRLQRILCETGILVCCWLVVHVALYSVQRVCCNVRWIQVIVDEVA